MKKNINKKVNFFYFSLNFFKLINRKFDKKCCYIFYCFFIFSFIRKYAKRAGLEQRLIESFVLYFFFTIFVIWTTKRREWKFFELTLSKQIRQNFNFFLSKPIYYYMSLHSSRKKYIYFKINFKLYMRIQFKSLYKFQMAVINFIFICLWNICFGSHWV